MTPTLTAMVAKAADTQPISFAWGSLTWYVSGELGTSDALTVGRCIIKPGCMNPRHFHPNCTEVLHVLQGKISHTIGADESVEMGVGDTISVPANIHHNAINTGDCDAVLLVCFSSPERKTVNL